MNFTRDLQYGNWSMPKGDVWDLQLGLQELGYGSFTPTGFFGTKTQTAVSQFQYDNGIQPASGYFGPKTQPVFIQKLSSTQTNRQKIYSIALENIGIDVTPDDIIPDEYDCADTICVILAKAGFSIGNIPLTTNMFTYLNKSKDWFRAYAPLPGDIILSPTGWGNGNLSNGHVGIVGEAGNIMSNSSSTGLFSQNYTLSAWKARYGDLGGFPVMFFRKS